MILTLIESDRTVQLPVNPLADQPDLTYKNISASGSTPISGNGSTIDGSSDDFSLESLGSVTFHWTGTGWLVVSAY
jgi:hypothetical protein